MRCSRCNNLAATEPGNLCRPCFDAEACICHETVVGKDRCPVHGSPAECARKGGAGACYCPECAPKLAEFVEVAPHTFRRRADVAVIESLEVVDGCELCPLHLPTIDAIGTSCGFKPGATFAAGCPLPITVARVVKLDPNID